MLANKRVTAKAPAMPRTIPSRVNQNASRRIIDNTAAARAPKAIRIPISLVRRSTPYAMIP